MTKRMLIDALHTEETRVVIADDDRIHEFDFVTAAKKQIKGNIYLAKVTRVEPSLQAAFVEYGGGKQCFLSFSEIHPDYYQIPTEDRQRLIDEEEAEAEAAEAEEEAAEEARQQRRGRRGGRGRRRGGRNRNRNRDNDNDNDSDNENGQNNDESAESSNDNDKDENTTIAAKAGDKVVKSDKVEDDDDTSNTDEQTDDANAKDDSNDESSRKKGKPANDDEPKGDNGDDEDEEDDVEEVSGEDDIAEAPKHRRKGKSFKRYKIQEVIKRNQIMLVQVIKEERGNKGVSLTTYMSLAGRYCVLMPNSPKAGGISRKIGNGEDRKRLKKIAADLKDSRGMSAIIRTAGIDRTRAEIKRDYEYLIKLWNQIREDTMQSTAPALIYEEGDIIKRSIRDLYTADVEEIWVDGDAAYKQAKSFMKMLMPSHAPRVKQHKDDLPLFYAYDVEDQLACIYEPSAKLPSGGSIVLQPTEALISIDVNSGRSTTERNVEETAIKTNLEAADEVARQLRLRDLAGLIVVDFIDMNYGRHRRQVERAMKDALKHDRAKIQVSRISSFGLMELSRQRLRPNILEASSQICPHCEGQGFIQSVETVAIQIIRIIEKEATMREYETIRVQTYSEAALHLLNDKRETLRKIEDEYDLEILIEIDSSLLVGNYKIIKVTEDGKEHVHDTSSNQDRGKRRRGRRGGRRRNKSSNDNRPDNRSRNNDNDADNDDDNDNDTSDEQDDNYKAKGDKDGENKKPRRRGGRGRGRKKDDKADANDGDKKDDAAASDDSAKDEKAKDEKPKRRRTSKKKDDEGKDKPAPAKTKSDDAKSGDDADTEPPKIVEIKERAEEIREEVAGDKPAPKNTASALAKAREATEPTKADNDEEDKKPKRRGWWNRG